MLSQKGSGISRKQMGLEIDCHAILAFSVKFGKSGNFSTRSHVQNHIDTKAMVQTVIFLRKGGGRQYSGVKLNYLSHL